MQYDCSPSVQWASADAGEVEFDADIVGPGVIASFIAAALTALLTIVAAFATYSIPTELTNAVDDLVAHSLRSVFTTLRKGLHIAPLARTDGPEARDNRIRAYQSFMLSVSDQILASELAILIATFANYGDITLYSVDVVIALGLLASTVHLAMMPLLVGGMRGHHIIKASRSITIVIAAGMLVVLLIFQLSDTWRNREHVYFRCALGDYQVDVKQNWPFYGMDLIVVVLLAYGNYEVIRLLYPGRKGHSSSCKDGGGGSVVDDDHDDGKISTAASPGRSTQPPSPSYSPNPESAIRGLWARHEARSIVQKQLSPRKQRLHALRIAEGWAFHECEDSFLWRILWLLSANVYGVINVFETRSATAGMSGERDKMGYGQIVPLVLLVLPAFAAMQSIYDYRDSIKDKVLAGKQPSPSQSPLSSSPRPPTSAGLGIELATILESHPQSLPASASLTRVDSASTQSAYPSTHSFTTATQASRLQASSSSPRLRQTALSRASTRGDTDIIPDVFRAPTIDPWDPHSHSLSQSSSAADNPSVPPSFRPVDPSLRKWALADIHEHTGSYTDLPFAAGMVYMHSVLMLVVAVLFAYATVNGPRIMVAVLYTFMLLVLVRRAVGYVYFMLFARRLKEKGVGGQRVLGVDSRQGQLGRPAGGGGGGGGDHAQRVMLASAGGEVVDAEEGM
ncbi:hypothetical protein BJY04DRAFT_218918 [Aspergillus karnatakaensis]|uniref:uncharacterized protein n=1 Tax=Aspergillus karnatakaensis TaxID=1810916 RepID=UPI003CCD3B53